MCRIFDGTEEVISAEYLPMVLQFGLSEEYDRQQITRLIPFLSYWPEENLALQVTVESLIRPRFQRWLRDTLMQCEKSQRKRIIFELAEADVGQHISRLRSVVRLINALGARVAVTQAGLTTGQHQLDQRAGCRIIEAASGSGKEYRKAHGKPAAGTKPGGGVQRNANASICRRRTFTQ